MSLAISLFVTIPVIYSGFKGVEVDQIKLARTFGASKAQILTKVILPGSIPTMIAALKVNAGLSLVRVVGDSQPPATSGQLIRSSCVCANCVSRRSRSRDQQKAEPI
jgi:NitT/TauT family transport system permease protein